MSVFSVADRFWGKVAIGEPGECWEWQGTRHRQDVITSDDVARTVAAIWPERRCPTCAHWRTTHCNVDGFHYCDDHYPEDYR